MEIINKTLITINNIRKIPTNTIRAISVRKHYPTNKKKTVFVTGDMGKLGTLVCQKLASKYNIIGYDLAASPIESINNKLNLERKMNGADFVVHLAAIPHPGSGTINDYFHINVEGTLNVLNAAVKNKIKRVIYISSTAYYGCDTKGKLNPLYFPIDEKHPIPSTAGITKGGLDEYGQSKVMAEQLCAYFGSNKLVEVIVLRSGPANSTTDQYPQDFNWEKDNSYKRGAFWANNDPKNIPLAISLALASKNSFTYEPFNILNQYTHETIPVKKFIKKEYPKTPIYLSLDRNPGLFDIRKAKRILGFKPIDVKK